MSRLKNAYALIIGTEYDDDLNTNGDAEDIAAILKDPAISGYLPENVMLLTGKDADRDGILNAFDELIDRTDENSSVFLYYSGHGGRYEDSEKNEVVFHFCPYGYRVAPPLMEIEEAEKVWLPASEVRAKINSLRSKRLIFFLDCCHSAGMTQGGVSLGNQSQSSDKGHNDGKDQKKFTQQTGLAQKVDNERGISIVSSCREDQESYQLEDDKNSLFTKCLLEVITGAHLHSVEEPYIRILDVSSYLMREVPKRLKEFGVEQKPYVNLQMYDNFIISCIPKKIREQFAVPEPLEAPEPVAKGQQEVKTSFRESPGATNLLLFIHGFSGEAADTFGKIPALLQEESRMDGWDMKPFGYSQYVDPKLGKDIWAGIADVDRIADYLCTSVAYKFDQYDRIAIVAHSLGGLIAQRAILDFKTKYQSKISHLIMFGTPSNGIEPEKLSKLWNAKYEDMSSEGAFIKGLRQDWKEMYNGGYPFTLKVVASADDEYVTAGSCFGPFETDACINISGGHLAMVKPKDAQSPAYKLILSTLTDTAFFDGYEDREAINNAMGKYDVVVKSLWPRKDELDSNGLKQLIFALEGVDRREEALQLLENHPKAQENTDLMGIIGGRYKRAYLKFPSESDGDAAMVYYELALEKSSANGNNEQIFYHAINLAFLSLVVENDRKKMVAFAKQAKDAALKCEDDLWKIATLGEANMYLHNFDDARKFYAKAADMAGIREKISIHLNAYAGYTTLMQTNNAEDPFIKFLKDNYLS
jgi:pimeloyl-ACP methyl ester carboxylesterase